MDLSTVDTTGASRRIGLAESTLATLRCVGGGPKFVKLGRAVRYRIADLDDFVAARVVSSTSEKIAA